MPPKLLDFYCSNDRLASVYTCSTKFDSLANWSGWITTLLSCMAAFNSTRVYRLQLLVNHTKKNRKGSDHGNEQVRLENHHVVGSSSLGASLEQLPLIVLKWEMWHRFVEIFSSWKSPTSLKLALKNEFNMST